MKASISNTVAAGIASVVFLLFSLSGLAQTRTAMDIQAWPRGEVILASGDTLSGELLFYRTQDVVNVQHADGTISSCTPVNVQYFVAHDVTGGTSHTFRTFRWDQDRDYTDFKKPAFFEQLNEGPITLMARETYVPRSSYGKHNAAYYLPAASQAADQVVELYYALLPGGDIVPLHNVRKSLFKLFGKKSTKVKDFMKQQNLSFDQPNDIVAVVNYFNALQ
ncbi:hypothetical protein [Pontibacter chitinilyticus]|uniref:hypothetical protein n=1 Tax=Pontibacter chitinilyticus TaxID=2674989 RepID=UPI00321A3EFF